MSVDAVRDRVALAVVGGGPAGLMAAETARAAGVEVDLYEGMGSVGRKFLLAGKGGLNLTHGEPFDAFVARYGERSAAVRRWLEAFDADALRAWARGLGVETFVGSSGRVFPADLKAAPLLRGWVRRLRERGVRFHVHHRWLGWDADGALRFATPAGERRVQTHATVLALGGASWPELGADGAWTAILEAAEVPVAPLRPSNCGFEVGWSAHFAERHAGAPVKPVAIAWRDGEGQVLRRQGEFVVTAAGVEGSLIYALSAPLRDAIAKHGQAEIRLDLAPDREAAWLADALARPRRGRSLSEHLRRTIGFAGVRAALLYERLPRETLADPATLAAAIKALPLTLQRTRPIAEAISTAGGVRLEALDEHLMLRARPGTFCAGEMLDWEAPTGGYLLTACFAGGRIAGNGAVAWLRARTRGGVRTAAAPAGRGNAPAGAAPSPT
ncbi:pyridine nucleotide-disulfide oxidoreductase [Mizugakiibacter sediminis]|uniref:NAD(FAD)-utilizing dehydrogenase n=1 Tax=Mizugakiibacter sediminis TaxID=1475481 RepID=A0A0K8QLA8_9GAMM|nr:TIGR03862 family flavoprotein [Mizugakiibacter sediminis]GAP65506.1 pyridine nucleotide-disulfide oxidoreductase [Mizugakiibacter sediminis]